LQDIYFFDSFVMLPYYCWRGL